MRPSPSGVASTATARVAPRSLPSASARAAGWVSRRVSDLRGAASLPPTRLATAMPGSAAAASVSASSTRVPAAPSALSCGGRRTTRAGGAPNARGACASAVSTSATEAKCSLLEQRTARAPRRAGAGASTASAERPIPHRALTDSRPWRNRSRAAWARRSRRPRRWQSPSRPSPPRTTTWHRSGSRRRRAGGARP